jgi:hypothetical protein
MEIINDDQWRLKSLSISFQEWGDYKGKYIGKIQFGNNQQEAFSFNIPEEKANAFLALVRDNIVDSAQKLGERVISSIPALEASKPTAIEDIPHQEQ